MKKFFSIMFLKKFMYLLIGFDGEIASGNQVKIGIFLTLLFVFYSGVNQQHFCFHLAVIAPSYIDSLCEMNFRKLWNCLETLEIKIFNFRVNMYKDIVSFIVKRSNQLFKQRKLIMRDNHYGVHSDPPLTQIFYIFTLLNILPSTNFKTFLNKNASATVTAKLIKTKK